jgi:hypothetical protein
MLLTSESLFSRKILAILSPKLVRITRLKVGPDSSCVRHALAHSRLRAVASTMTLRRDAFPASPVNARLSWALRLALLLQCSPSHRRKVFFKEKPLFGWQLLN